MKFRCSFFLLLVPLLSSCTTAPKFSKTKFQKTLTLLFAGDIMAHEPNFRMKNYSKIWETVSPLLLQSDFAFANLESSVDDEKAFSGYPRFNMKKKFPEAAIDAGFNVFSLANNHTADNGKRGIFQTKKWSENISKTAKGSSREVFFSGIKNSGESETGNLQYTRIEKKGWRILFCAVTEITNEKNDLQFFNYVSPDKKSRENFLETLKKIREENICDIFIVSMHGNLPEYEKTISEEQKKFYRAILNAGVDILWGNHPHLVLETEIAQKKSDKNFPKLIFYANGNTISAQRTKYNFENPASKRENTGDGMLSLVKLTKRNKKARAKIESVKPFFITTVILKTGDYVIRFLDDDFISDLQNKKKPHEANYFQKRKKIMEEKRIFTQWQ